MEKYGVDDLLKDFDTFREVLSRLKNFMKMDEIIGLIVETQKADLTTSNFSTNNGEINKTNNKLKDLTMTETEKILNTIKDKGTAYYKDIFYSYANNYGEPDVPKKNKIGAKRRHQIRGLMSSLKQRDKVEGNAVDGFRIKSNGGELFT